MYHITSTQLTQCPTQSHSINATDDKEDDFDSGSSDDGDDDDDKIIMIIKGSCPLVPNSVILKMELCYKSDVQKVVSCKGYVSWKGSGKSHSSLLGEAI